MNVKIIEDVPKKKEIKYPILMRDLHSDYVVLFNSAKSGMIMRTNKNSALIIGDFTDTWVSAEDELQWEPFDGKIELSN